MAIHPTRRAPADTQPACADPAVSPEWFFPLGLDEIAERYPEPSLREVHTEYNRDNAARARAVCATCPMQMPCLEFAAAERMVGVWGGVLFSARGFPIANRRTRRGASDVPAPAVASFLNGSDARDTAQLWGVSPRSLRAAAEQEIIRRQSRRIA